MAYIGKTPVIGNFVKLDSITVVNGQAAYTMQNGGVNFTSYDNVNQFLVSLNGVLQAPTDSFTVSGSTLTFASNLATGDVIDFVIVLGNTLDIGTPSDNTVSLAKLTATGTKDATTFLRGDNTFAEVSTGFTLATTQATTSGTSIDFTGIPSTARLIIINFFDYSKSGGNGTIIQLGTSSGIVTTGYTSTSIRYNTSSGSGGRNNTDGFVIADENASFNISGQALITSVDPTNYKWLFSFTGKIDTSNQVTSGGDITLSADLTQLRIKPTGSDTFDAGSINIQYI